MKKNYEDDYDFDFDDEDDVDEKSNSDGKSPLSLAAMISGIASLILLFIPGLSVLSVPAAILAIILAAVAKGKEGKNGLRTAGLVLGIATLTLLLVLFVVTGVS